LTPQEAVEIAAASLRVSATSKDLHHTAVLLVETALERGSTDNISVLVVKLGG